MEKESTIESDADAEQIADDVSALADKNVELAAENDALSGALEEAQDAIDEKTEIAQDVAESVAMTQIGMRLSALEQESSTWRDVQSKIQELTGQVSAMLTTFQLLIPVKSAEPNPPQMPEMNPSSASAAGQPEPEAEPEAPAPQKKNRWI
jgi:uncharacterized phage infection (PIP) family protein YhgE